MRNVPGVFVSHYRYVKLYAGIYNICNRTMAFRDDIHGPGDVMLLLNQIKPEIQSKNINRACVEECPEIVSLSHIIFVKYRDMIVAVLDSLNGFKSVSFWVTPVHNRLQQANV